LFSVSSVALTDVRVARRSEGSIVFGIVADFLCEHDNSKTAAFSLMKFCMNMVLDNL